MRAFIIALAGFLASGLSVCASDAERGRAATEQWCAQCHAERETDTVGDMAPAFETIAARPWVNAGRLRSFLDEDHFPMTTFRLFPEEKDGVVAYLMALRTERLSAGLSAAERGHAVTQEWCAQCHAERETDTVGDMAPAFETIAARPWVNAGRLRSFLDEDHFPMTTFRLFPEEKDDVVAYLIELRG